jgi:hypothetical protein
VPQPFAIAPGPRYEGPHGPAAIPANQQPDSTRVELASGSAELAWGMASDDRGLLEQGVAAKIGGRELALSLRGRTLELQDSSGAVAAVASRGRRGRVDIEGPDGTSLAWFKPTQLAGEVEEAAGPDDVAFMLLLLASNAGSALERRVPLPFLQ